MKNKIVSFLFLSSLAFLHAENIYAANPVCTNDLGVLHCSAGNVDSIFHLGNVFLSGTHVSGELNATGNVSADNAEVGQGSITGNVDASHLTVHNTWHSVGIFRVDSSQFNAATTVTGNVEGSHDVFSGETEMTGDISIHSETFKGIGKFTGKVDAEATTFAAPIVLNACLAKFSQSTTAQIQMTKQKDCPDGSNKLFLSEKTNVNGNINFPGGNGQVYLSKDSIINGQVNGGTIIHN